jgi:transposase
MQRQCGVPKFGSAHTRHAQEIPHHSTFSKNRHGRFQESKLFEHLFEQIVRQCVEVGLAQGQQRAVDGSFVEANAAKESRISS